MDPNPFELSKHARRRMDQRAIPPSAVEAALDWGRAVKAGGAWHHRLDRRSVRGAALHGVDVRQWEGVNVVTTGEGLVLTAYRNRDAKRLRR